VTAIRAKEKLIAGARIETDNGPLSTASSNPISEKKGPELELNLLSFYFPLMR
jgi:hypothetical protein